MFSLYKSTILSLITASALSGSLLAHGHTELGTNYGEQGVDTYAKTLHGVDGALFLDPYFMPYLKESQGQILLDAGCGAGPWSIYAAQHGATVYGIDFQEKMIEKANSAALEANVEAQFLVGDVGNLPYPNEFFDKAVSINVGCNLPSLQAHIKELKRVLKKGGSALITAPHSFDVLFSDGTQTPEQLTAHIQKLLSTNNHPTAIQGLDEIYRATFANREGQWRLVTNEQDLLPGEDIWRKIPKMVVPNRYHSEQEYLSLFESEGLSLKHIYHPKLKNEPYPLSASYAHSSPFVIFILEN